MKKFDLVVAGHICLDIAPKFALDHSFPEVFSPGKLTEIGPAHFSTGGVVSNTGFAAKKFGLQTALLAKIGKDSFGTLIKELLTESEDDILLCEDEVFSTSYTIALNLPGEDRVFLHHPGVNNHFYASDLEYSLIAKSKIFHLGYPPLMASLYKKNGQELVRIMSKAKEVGAITSLDMAMPDPNSASGQVNWEIILQNIAPFVDIFLPSYEELFLMLEKEKYLNLRNTASGQDFTEIIDVELLRKMAKRLHSFGMGIVVIKAGKNGLYIKTPEQERLQNMKNLSLSSEWADKEYWAEALKPDTFVSTTGAGDCAVAGFLAALLRGFGPEKSLRIAILAGYQNLRAVDAMSGLGNWDEVLLDLNKKGLEYLQLNLEEHGFKKIGEGFWGFSSD